MSDSEILSEIRVAIDPYLNGTIVQAFLSGIRFELSVRHVQDAYDTDRFLHITSLSGYMYVVIDGQSTWIC